MNASKTVFLGTYELSGELVKFFGLPKDKKGESEKQEALKQLFGINTKTSKKRPQKSKKKVSDKELMASSTRLFQTKEEERGRELGVRLLP